MIVCLFQARVSYTLVGKFVVFYALVIAIEKKLEVMVRYELYGSQKFSVTIIMNYEHSSEDRFFCLRLMP